MAERMRAAFAPRLLSGQSLRGEDLLTGRGCRDQAEPYGSRGATRNARLSSFGAPFVRVVHLIRGLRKFLEQYHGHLSRDVRILLSRRRALAKPSRKVFY